MINQSDLQYVNGADVYAAGGGKIGSAGQVYLDDRTGEPEWLSVRTGLAGTRESFVPLNRATLTDDRLEVPFDKDRVKNAPRVGTDGEIGPGDEDKLSTYYGLGSVHGYQATSETVRLRKYVVTSRQPPAPVRRPAVG